MAKNKDYDEDEYSLADALQWALGTSPSGEAPEAAKLTLVTLCSEAQNWVCSSSTRKIARVLRCDEESVSSAIASLELDGFISKVWSGYWMNVDQ